MKCLESVKILNLVHINTHKLDLSWHFFGESIIRQISVSTFHIFSTCCRLKVIPDCYSIHITVTSEIQKKQMKKRSQQ